MLTFYSRQLKSLVVMKGRFFSHKSYGCRLGFKTLQKKKEDSPAPLAGMRLRQHRDSALGADKTDNLGLKV